MPNQKNIIITRSLKNDTIKVAKNSQTTFIAILKKGWDKPIKIAFEFNEENATLNFIAFIIGTKQEKFPFETISSHTATHTNAYLVGEPLTVTYRHPNGTLIKYQTYPEVYLLDKGSRRHIANETAFLGLGYHWSAMVTVPDWEQYPDGTEIQLP
mgnify:CR=1 FL=1